jgi:hypothetical protein
MQHFKDDISIDKADIGPYRTIVMQATQPKRVTMAKFFRKKLKKIGCVLIFTTGKSER